MLKDEQVLARAARKMLWIAGRLIDVIQMSILRREWREVAGRLRCCAGHG